MKRRTKNILSIQFLALLLLGSFCVMTAQSKSKPDVMKVVKSTGGKMVTLIRKLQNSGIVKISYSKAKSEGKVRCDSKYKATSTHGKAFLHLGNLKCYSCPKGYHRTINPDVNAGTACERRAYSKWSRYESKKKGKVKNVFGFKCPKGHFRHRLSKHCYRCPSGYKRTVFDIGGSKACEKVVKADHKKTQYRGKSGCDKGFQHGLTNRCYSCPKGYKRSLVITNDPSKHGKACERIKVNPPKKVKDFMNKQIASFKKNVYGKHKKTFSRAISLMKTLNPTNIARGLTGSKKTKERILRDIVKKTKIKTVLSSLFKKNVFSTGTKEDGASCKNSDECRSGSTCTLIGKKCTYMDMRTLTFSFAVDVNFFFSFEFANTMGIRMGDKPNGSSKVHHYREFYFGGGYTKGADAAFDIGAFNAVNDELGGELMGVTFALSGAVGNSIGVTNPAGGAAASLWFTCPGKTACFFGKKNDVYLAGIQFGPQYGKSFEAEFGIVTASEY